MSPVFLVSFAAFIMVVTQRSSPRAWRPQQQPWKRLLFFLLFIPFYAFKSRPVAGGELRGVCGDFILSLKPALFLRLLLGGGTTRPFYLVKAKAAPWSSVILRPENRPGPLHDAVRISLNLTSEFGHYLTHRQPWTAVAISPLLGLISMA